MPLLLTLWESCREFTAAHCSGLDRFRCQVEGYFSHLFDEDEEVQRLQREIKANEALIRTPGPCYEASRIYTLAERELGGEEWG